jgi:PPP family 3-phenylpropionic acid transporter
MTITQTGRPSLFVPKALYFLNYASIGILFPFIGLYYHQIGLTGMQIGFLGAISPLVGLVITPVWGLINDRLSKAHLLLALASAGAAISVFALSLTSLYPIIILIVFFQSFFVMPVSTLIDSASLRLLGGRRELYGRQRLWGSIGFIITSVLLGQVLEQTGLKFILYGYAVLMGAFCLTSLSLPRQQASVNRPQISGIWALVRQPVWAWFTASTVLLNMAYSGMLTFLSLYLQKMGGSPGLIGNVYAVGAISEIPIMFLGAWIIARYPTRRLVAFAYFAHAVRFALYILMPSPVWALPIALLNSLTYGLLMISAVAYIDQLAPPEWKSVALGLYYSAFSLGGMLGGPINGWIFDAAGGKALFTVSTLLTIIAIVLLYISGRKLQPISPISANSGYKP